MTSCKDCLPHHDESALTVIIPIYNEHDSVEPLVKRLKEITASADYPLCWVIVDDGSDDGTEKKLAAVDEPSIHIVRQHQNRGYGAALKRGIRLAQSEYVAIADGDGTYPLERLSEFFQKARDNELDMVVGARTGANVHIPLIRRPAKWCLRQLANYLSGTVIPDLNSGLRLMRRNTVLEYVSILPDGFSFTTTITLAMLCNDYAVEFLPIDYHQRQGHSKIRPIRDTLNFIQLICRTVLYFKPLRIFVPLSLCLVLLAFTVLAVTHYGLGRATDVTFGVIFMSAVQMFAVGLLADMLAKRSR